MAATCGSSARLPNNGLMERMTSALPLFPMLALPPAVDHIAWGNQDPAPADSSASPMDSLLRQTIAPGNIALENIDPDGDEVAINSLVNGTKGVDEKWPSRLCGCWQAYGTLYMCMRMAHTIMCSIRASIMLKR